MTKIEFHLKWISVTVLFLAIIINLIFLLHPLYHGSLWGTYGGEVEGKSVEISFDGNTYQMSVADQAHAHGIYEYERNADMKYGYNGYALIALDNGTQWGMWNIFSVNSIGLEEEYTIYNAGAIAIQVVLSIITLVSFGTFVFIKAKEN